jgi:hypothetical protein
MMEHINTAITGIETNSKTDIKAALLKGLELYAEEKGIVPGVRVDVDDIISSLESKNLFKAVQTSEPIEELQEKQENAENITRMRPVEDSDEESVEEETDLALYRKKRLMEETSKPHSTEKKRNSNKYANTNSRQHYEKKNIDKKKTKSVPSYQAYPYYPPVYFYYPSAYPPGARFQQPSKGFGVGLVATEEQAVVSEKKIEQTEVPVKAPEIKVEQKPDQKKTLPKRRHTMTSSAILIRHVPPELNTISSIDSYFSK